MERILITGATGFIGSFIVEEALRRGMEVWVAIRRPTLTIPLEGGKNGSMPENLHIVHVNLDSENQLESQLRDLSFDYVVHAAGATKARNAETFYKVNTEGTKHLVDALNAKPIKRLVFLSSLSVFGPVKDVQPYEEITDKDIPQPNSDYGKSKLEAEKWLKANCKIPFTILRPTGVYGPREKDYKVMIDSISRGMDVAVGGGKQDLTFVYVSDVVQAVFKALKSEKAVGKAYFLSDGEVYASKDFSDYIIEALGKKYVLRPVFPLWVLKAVCAISDLWMRLTGHLSTLNNDHYNILRQRNWRCDIKPAMEDLGYEPKVKLREGVRLTVAN